MVTRFPIILAAWAGVACICFPAYGEDITVTIKLQHGATWRIDGVPSDGAVCDLKMAIQRELGIAPNEIVVIHSRIPLRNDTVLDKIGIGDNPKVFAKLRPNPPPFETCANAEFF